MSYLAWGALIVAVVGTGVSVASNVQQAKTAEATGKYNAKVAENQALQTEMDAAESIKRKRRENKRLLATQRSRYAKAGVVEEGTPLELLAETAGLLELEALDYDRQKRMEAAGLRAQGAADRALGSNQARAGYLNAGSTLLSGTANAAYMGSQISTTRTTSSAGTYAAGGATTNSSGTVIGAYA